MLVSYYLPGNSLAPPPALRARGHSAHGEEEQSLFDPSPHGWSAGGGAIVISPSVISKANQRHLAIVHVRMLLVIIAWLLHPHSSHTGAGCVWRMHSIKDA